VCNWGWFVSVVTRLPGVLVVGAGVVGWFYRSLFMGICIKYMCLV